MAHFVCSFCPKSFSVKRSMVRHMLSHDERKQSCKTCNKSYHRSDLLLKHQVKCVKTSNNVNTCDLCNKSFGQKCHLTRHQKICVVKCKKDKLEQATEEYKKKLKEGELLEKVLRKCPDTMEEALDANEKECLKLYQISCEGSMDMDSVVLKRWQQEVIRLIDIPSERNIYWIVGAQGNEGKTYIQKYIHQLFGSRRVMKTEVNTKKADIAYILSKESLTCKDIFLFNLLRSDTDVAYGLLENIKDGYLISSKYRSKSLKIKIPNTVIVFSNSFPLQSQLSMDRWKIFEICGDKLCTKPASADAYRKVNPHLSTKNYTVYYD